MAALKFSHMYKKMPPDFRVSRLIQIENVNLEDVDPDFLMADTEIVGGGNYPLPKKGKYMILWLESSIMNIRWQTIRRWTKEKEKYYLSLRGKLLNCIITD